MRKRLNRSVAYQIRAQLKLRLFSQFTLKFPVVSVVLEQEVFTDPPVPRIVPALEVDQVLEALLAFLVLALGHVAYFGVIQDSFQLFIWFKASGNRKKLFSPIRWSRNSQNLQDFFSNRELLLFFLLFRAFLALRCRLSPESELHCHSRAVKSR